jgi:phosphomannomutase/phosphoglucomutase
MITMNLARVFLLIMAIALCFIIGMATSFYFVTERHTLKNYSQEVQNTAQTAANYLIQLINLLNGTIDRVANEPQFAKLLESGNPSLIQIEEERLTRLLPGALIVRILPPNIGNPLNFGDLDTARMPQMGFADLDLVRQTIQGKSPQPAVHAASTPNAHFAVTRKLPQGNGVILVSFSLKLLVNTIPSKLEVGAMELQQESLSVQYRGDASLKKQSPDGSLAIPGTPLKLVYWFPTAATIEMTWFLLIPAIALVGLSICVFILYRWLIRAVEQDQESVANLVSDLLTSGLKVRSSYPSRIGEFQQLIDQLINLNLNFKFLANTLNIPDLDTPLKHDEEDPFGPF